MKNWFLVLGLVLVIGCKDQYQDCHKTAPTLYTYGYDSTEVDTVLVSRYEKGSNFSKKIDDLFFSLNQPPSYRTGIDSFYFTYPGPNTSTYVEQYEDFDWAYTILSDSNVTKVTEVKRQNNNTNSNNYSPSCLSPITSLRINGVPTVLQSGDQHLSIFKR